MMQQGTATRHDQGLLDAVEASRRRIAARLDPDRQRRLGQYLTPAPVAEFMASLVDVDRPRVRILEPGAGVGSLIAALIDDLCSRGTRPEHIEVVGLEIDPGLIDGLKRTMSECRRHCRRHGVAFSAEIVTADFVEFAVSRLEDQLSFETSDLAAFDVIIQNPPYRKIRSTSRERRLLQRVGIETSNLYAAFLALGARLLADHGQLVAITPRSFCNGPYFRAFRRQFLQLTRFTRIHTIDSRSEAFADDGVLQENIIFKSVRGISRGSVVVTAGNGSVDGRRFGRRVPYDQLVRPDDPDLFIHLVPEPDGSRPGGLLGRLSSRLEDFGIAVSTGRVVDFRAREYLRQAPTSGTAPLIYPVHFRSGFIEWPVEGRKPNAIIVAPDTQALLVPEGIYVLVKRFSAKEQARRVVAAVFDPASTPAPRGVGFENHVNYFHSDGRGLTRHVALGLAAYLNSTAVDMFFRQFSGHTQVNASDLRKLPYPSREMLETIGSQIGADFPCQEELDRLVDRFLGEGSVTAQPS